MSTTAIWNNFSDHLFNFILQQVKSKSHASDILQDVFIKVHINRNQLKEVEKLESWLFRITRNTITDHFRKNQKQLKLTNEIPAMEVEEFSLEKTKNLEFMADLYAQRLDEFDVEIDSDLEKTIDFFKTMCPFMEELDPKYAEAVFWVDWHGMPQKEFAVKVGISLSGAKSRVQRGREHLKSLFNQCCEFVYDKRGKVIDYNRRPKSGCNC